MADSNRALTRQGRQQSVGSLVYSPSPLLQHATDMTKVKYSTVPDIDVESPPESPTVNGDIAMTRLYSRTSSKNSDDASGSDRGTDRRRDDRRRGRLNSELLSAVLERQTDEIEKRLTKGASVNATCRTSRSTVLHLATICGYSEIVKLLLLRGASTKLRDKEGRQAIHFAAASGNEEILKMILDKDISAINNQIHVGTVDRTDNDSLDSWSHDHEQVASKIPFLISGSTPLHLATQRTNWKCVKLLLEMNARTDIVDDRGLSPLDVAGEIGTKPPASESSEDFADNIRVGGRNKMNILPNSNSSFEFLKRTARSVPVPTKMSNLPLPPTNMKVVSPRSSTSQGFSDGSSFEDKSTDVPSDGSESTPGFPILDGLKVKRKISTVQKVVNALIMKGAKMPQSKVIVKQGHILNQRKMPVTCVHTAVESGNIELIQYLLQNGGCVLTWNESGLTPIHLAVVKRLLDPLKALLEWDNSFSTVDVRDSMGRTPLYLAVEEEWMAGVSFLLEAGADIKVTSNENQTVLHLAAKKGNVNLLEEVLSIPDSVKIIDWRNKLYETPLCCAVSAGKLLSVQLLLQHSADITTSLPGDVTLLHIAAENGNQIILDTLLRHPVVENLKDVRSNEGKGGMTPLHISALGGFVNCVKSLIAVKCNLYAKTTDSPHFGATALHLAARAGNIDVVKCIITYDKKTLCAKNSDNWYPLHVAARFSHKECVGEMLKNGANLASSIIDSGGYKRTGLDIIVYSVLHPISFLEDCFDSFIEVNEYPLNNPKCIIKVNYDILTPLGTDRKQLRVLDSLLNCSKQILQENLLLHPLIETFLYLKWKKLRVFFFLIMALYLTFTLSLTSMAMFIYVLHPSADIIVHCITICRVVLLTSLTLIILQELMHAARMQRYYFKDFESWMKWSAFLTASIVVVFDHSVWWLIHITTISVLLAWLELLFLLSRWPSAMGFYILMFFTVANKVVRVLATFMFVLIGFTFAFLIHFQATAPFSNWWEALVKVFAMTSEFEYVETFEGFPGITSYSIIGRSIFIVYVVLVAIVLMNLLVGLAVSDIATLERQGRAQRLAKQIDFLSLLELFVYNQSILFCCPNSLAEAIKRRRAATSCLSIEPGKPLHGVYQDLPQQMKQSVINRVQKIKLEETNKLYGHQDDVDRLSNQLNNSIKSYKTVHSSISVLNSEAQPVDQNINQILERILMELTDVKHEINKLKADTKTTATEDIKTNHKPLIYC